MNTCQISKAKNRDLRHKSLINNDLTIMTGTQMKMELDIVKYKKVQTQNRLSDSKLDEINTVHF